MSLNSVNWSRIMVQIAHFFYAYLQLGGLEGAELPELEVVVPTGGAGNITGGLKVLRIRTSDLHLKSCRKSSMFVVLSSSGLHRH